MTRSCPDSRSSQHLSKISLTLRLAARRLDDLAGHALEPLEALPAHPLGEDGDRLAGQQVGVVGAAAAVVAGRRPHGLLGRRIELTGDQTGNQAAEGGADLVGAGREPLAHEHQDPGIDAGELRRELEVVDPAVLAAVGHGLVVPGDPEQVERIEIPQTDILELCLHLVRDQVRVAHLGEGRNPDVALPSPAHGRVEGGFVHGEIDHQRSFRLSARASFSDSRSGRT